MPLIHMVKIYHLQTSKAEYFVLIIIIQVTFERIIPFLSLRISEA